MILDSIILDNFGVYGGRQQIDLTPVSENKPIILFGGMNGGGKTTLLDAVQLAFYGSNARCAHRGKLDYKDFLRATIHRGSDTADGASLEIRFRRAVDGVMHYYRLHRAWCDGAKGIEEFVEVTRDGELDSLLSEHWEEYIESYIPSGIAHLFFFDAEQIKELADGQHAAELLGTAITSLLGLDLVDRLDTDLVVLERRKKTEGKTGEAARRLKHAQEELDRVQHMFDQATQEKGWLQNQADQVSKALSKCREKFRLEGGELYLRRADMEEEKKRLQATMATEATALRDLAAGDAPLLLIPGLLEETERQVRRETEGRTAEVLVSALDERDACILELLRREKKIPAPHLAHVEATLREDREGRRSLLAEPCYLNADDHLAAELRHLRSVILPETAARIKGRIETATAFDEKLARLETELARVPDADAIAALHRELLSLQQQEQEKLAEVAAQQSKVEVLSRQLETAMKARDREFGEDAENKIAREDHSRVLKHSARVRSTLSKFRAAVIRKHAARIERLMLESFTQLLRKTNLVTGLIIDPETFQIELKGGDGKPLPFDRLSAGERQLLATSLLWGLARASGRPLPTIIDTPLGRLDSSHRLHLLERYFPVASHQVILLSTDEEINEANLKRLEPYIGRSYHLQFDETLRATKVTPGYFWTNEATC